jgi:hypothetical protein
MFGSIVQQPVAIMMFVPAGMETFVPRFFNIYKSGE